MKLKNSTRVVLLVSGFFTVFIVMIAFIPFLSECLKVEVQESDTTMITEIPEHIELEEQLLTVLYQQEQDTREITAIYIEVFHPGKETIYYMEIPIQTKIMLSNELYKSLQTYSPDLPQYLKLSKMAEGFSKEYMFTGCNRILSELFGISLTHYVSGCKKDLQHWLKIVEEKTIKEKFFEQYATWLENSTSDLSNRERFIYYESYEEIKNVEKKVAIGTEEIGEFIISSKQCREMLENWKYMLRTENKEKEE